MEESDRFLVSALLQSNCLPDLNKDIQIHALVCQDLVAIVIKCLTCIQRAETHLDLSLPAEALHLDRIGVAAKHRIGSQLAKIIKELGYAGDCGYNHFLYPNEKETRSVLSWLVGKLPSKEIDNIQSNTTHNLHLTDHSDYSSGISISNVFTKWKNNRTLYLMPNREWKDLKGYQRLPFQSTSLLLPWETSQEEYWFDRLSNGTNFALSVIEAMSRSGGRSRLRLFDDFEGIEDVQDWEESLRLESKELNSSVNATTNASFVPENGDVDEFDSPEYDQDETNLDALPQLPAFVPSENITKNQPTAEDSIDSELQSMEKTQEYTALMNARLIEVKQQIEQLQIDIHAEDSEIQGIQCHVDQIKQEGQVLKKDIASRKKMLSLLPQAQENIAKLEAICAKNQAKLDQLSLEWEKERHAMIKEEKELSARKSSRKARCRQYIQEIKLFRTEMKEMAVKIQDKMEKIQVLEKKLASLPSTMTRTGYTNRIMDIIKQVSKQKQEINKVLEDIKSIQKQLNTASETLKRSEAVTEDKLYHDAQTHVTSKGENISIECYRKFAQVRELYEELISIVNDVGKKESTARDLENWIMQLKSRDHSVQLDKILADLQSVRQENAALTQQLRSI